MGLPVVLEDTFEDKCNLHKDEHQKCRRVVIVVMFYNCENEVKNLEEIMFGCAVCANGVVLDKIIHGPSVVTLNSKTKNKIFCPPQILQKR